MKKTIKRARIDEFKQVMTVQPIVGEQYIMKLSQFENFTDWLDRQGFFDAPASAKYHGTEPGDLFKHSLKVAQILADYTKRLDLEWSRPCSPWIIGLFHDLCKMDHYTINSFDDMLAGEGIWKWNEEQLLDGHGSKSVMLLSQFMTLTEEEIVCIRYHMGLFEPGDLRDYSRAVAKYPNVLYTHSADMLASTVYGI